MLVDMHWVRVRVPRALAARVARTCSGMNVLIGITIEVCLPRVSLAIGVFVLLIGTNRCFLLRWMIFSQLISDVVAILGASPCLFGSYIHAMYICACANSNND